ncbi:DUF2199 domain-containing protein [Actinoplanes sp. NPDC048796]|uniref:DUF2199 domain-containing protein n=1 Tax=Actinoplanes sp. NPDC048796 TaxID=3155640 RepID=UPI0033D8907B
MLDHLAGCSCCGAPLDALDLDVRSGVPDALLDLSAEQQAKVWGNSDLQRLEGVGGFVRCLMPVRLTGGGSVTYSVWLKVDDDQLRHANAVWSAPAYADLVLNGTVANAVRPWPEMLGEAARAEVRDEGTLPYLAGAGGTLLSRVLTEQWDRDDVLSRIGHALPAPVRQAVTGEWSIERSAGLEPRVADGVLMFAGPGRTVHVEVFDLRDGTTPEAAIARFTKGAPEPAGEVSERDGDVARYAFWLTAAVRGREQFELYGYAATASSVAAVTCMYDDAADLGWAQEVWRSLRRHG